MPRAMAPITCAIPNQIAVTNLRRPWKKLDSTDGFERFLGLTGARPDPEFRPCGRDADEVRGRVFAADGEAI
jgi:hypothetical protein